LPPIRFHAAHYRYFTDDTPRLPPLLRQPVPHAFFTPSPWLSPLPFIAQLADAGQLLAELPLAGFSLSLAGSIGYASSPDSHFSFHFRHRIFAFAASFFA
jgi:hypothetical protein